jgi:glycosyltransferase involved in cell wall biosynthesis
MKVSILVPVFNCCSYISTCIDSICNQNYQDIEIIVIDGGSYDGTIAIVANYGLQVSHFISQKDSGMYDAVNKGLQVASGDVIGILNADDYFPDKNVVSSIVDCFIDKGCEAVYGNLNYVRRDEVHRIIRRWKSRSFTANAIRLGWMPAHPTVYIKRSTYHNFGPYLLNFGSCGDYELMLRYFFTHKIRAHYLDKFLVNMREGGMSNGSMRKRYHALLNDYNILVYSKVPNPMLVTIVKRLRKINQYF